MGYKVTLSTSWETEKLCELLTDTPEKLFQIPFFGYVVFLLTGAERNLLDRLTAQLNDFESLSGDHFAYIFVAKECPLPIQRVEWEQRAYTTNHASRNSIPVQVEKRSLASIKSEGIKELGEIFNKSEKGELIALSDGANEVAKWFGVSPQLPCILVFNAKITTRPIAITINKAIIDNVVIIFRNVVGRTSGPAYRKHLSAIRRIGEIRDVLEQKYIPDSPSLATLRTTVNQRVSRYANLVDGLDQSLRDGSNAGDVQRQLTNIEDVLVAKHDNAHLEVKATHSARKKLVGAIRNADVCLDSLSTEREVQVKPRRIFRRSVAPLLSAELGSKVPSNAIEWQSVRRALVAQLDELVLRVLGTLPNPQTLDWASAENVRRIFDQKMAQIDALRHEIVTLEKEDRELRLLVDKFDQPSFSTIVQDEVRKFGATSVALKIGSAMSSWISKPANATKIVKWALTAAGL